MNLILLENRCRRAWVDTLSSLYVPPRCVRYKLRTAPLMILGEAPGAVEEMEGQPFVGASGMLLKSACESVGLAWRLAHITNVVKYRPITNDGKGNRPPTAKEIDRFRDILYAEIEAVDPRVILCLGATAMRGLKKNPPSMSSVVGKVVAFRMSLTTIYVLPAWHPAYIMYNGGVKGSVYQDFLSQLKQCASLVRAHTTY